MTTSPKFLSYPVLGGNINPKKILLVLGDPLQSVLPNGKFCGFTCVSSPNDTALCYKHPPSQFNSTQFKSPFCVFFFMLSPLVNFTLVA